MQDNQHCSRQKTAATALRAIFTRWSVLCQGATGAAAFESVGLWSYMLGTGSQSGTRVGNTSGSDPGSGSGSGLGNGAGSGGDGAFIRKSRIGQFIYRPMPRRRSRLSGQAEPICWPEINYRFQEWLRLAGEFFASPPSGRTFTSRRS